MKLLYATDGFGASRRAAELIARAADPNRVEVSVISVNPRGLPDLEYAVLMIDALEDRRKDTVTLVNHWVEWFRAKGFRATGRAAEGRPGDEIVAAVDGEGFDLTVLGGGHHSWLGNRLLGSVSNHVLHASPTGVMVVHESTAIREETRILVAADGSIGCEIAARQARELLAPGATRIRIVSCFAPITVLALPGSAGSVRMPSGADYGRAIYEAESIAERSADNFRGCGFTTDSKALWGSPVEQILKEADSWSADMVIVGSRGRGAITRTLLGSVSDQLVRHAPATLVGRDIH